VPKSPEPSEINKQSYVILNDGRRYTNPNEDMTTSFRAPDGTISRPPLGPPTHLYSVNKFTVQDDVGQFGTYYFNACKDGEPYAATLITGRRCWNDRGGDKFDPTIEASETLAADMLTRMSQFGLFMAAGEKPEPHEVAAARQALKERDTFRIREADSLWEMKHDRSRISDEARRAAKRLNQTKPWLDTTSEMPDTKKCQFCKTHIDAEATVCPQCSRDLVPGVNTTPQPAARVTAKL
jgi:hypothetical protein